MWYHVFHFWYDRNYVRAEAVNYSTIIRLINLFVTKYFSRSGIEPRVLTDWSGNKIANILETFGYIVSYIIYYISFHILLKFVHHSKVDK